MHSLIQALRRRARGARLATTHGPSQTLRFEPLETRRLLATVALQDFSVSNGTGEKPQSKVWEHAEQWWTVMPSSGGTSVWRLDGTSWTPTLFLSSKTNVTADVKSVGDVTHVLLFDGGNSQLASIEYDGAGNYVAWTMRPTLVPVPLAGAETATIDLDSTGRLWVAADSGSQVQVRYADGLYQAWSAPITVASGINSDDISVITALPNGTVGVLWSNQSSRRFGFRYHVDGADPTAWSADEVPAAAAALNVGGGMADDHLNVAVASDGTLYVAVKTSYDSGSRPKIGLLVRRPNGVWDDALYSVDAEGTRPIVLLNEATGKLIVAYAASEGTANIVYRETDLQSISFGPRQTMIGGSVQNVSSTKQNFTDEVVLIASNGSTLKSVLFSFGSIVINQPPNVDAGSDQTVVIGTAVALHATVQDDGHPAATSLVWSKLSGPGTATFDDASKPGANVTFSQPGTYVLRVVATDGQYFDADEVTIIVTSPIPDPSPSEIVSASFQDGVGGYTGGRDTMIRALNANTNYGSLTALEVDGSPDIAALLAWDLASIPVGSVIVSAAIELTITNSSAHAYGVYAMERAWDEFGATWNLAGPGRSWGAAGANAATDRSSASLAAINARSTGLLRIDFAAAGLAVVQQWINNPAANHGVILQNYFEASDGFDFRSNEYSTATQRPRLVVTYMTPGGGEPTPANAPPTVNAGPDRAIMTGQSASLAGTVADDGRPGPLTIQWSKQSGPGNVAFANGSSATTSATFSAPGTYVLRLTASDGELSSFDQVTVTVSTAPPNLPPSVSVGIDRTVQLSSALSLSGVISDDGVSGPLTATWSKASGPGTATFGNASSPTTTVTFSQAGTYVLRLTASDGQYSAWDELAVTVQPAAPPSSTPVTVSFQDGVAGYAGTRDTMIRAQNASTNYGTLNALETDGSPDIASLLSWDLSAIPSGSVILSATIELYITNTTDDNYQVLAMERAWRELEATWNQAGAGLPWAAAGASAAGDRFASALGTASPRSNGRYAITLNAAGVAAVQQWIDDPSRNFGVIIQNYASASNGFDFRSRETADATQRPKLILSYQAAAAEPQTPPGDEEPTNEPPQVFAGMDRTATAGASITLNGVVTDDGGQASLTYWWSQITGPAAAQFANSSNLGTSVTFPTPGVYTLRLQASDGELTSYDDLVVTVTAPVPENQAPVVAAGADIQINQTDVAQLSATVTDDGPVDAVTVAWSKISGPGNVTFSNPAATTSQATFSAPGVYVLRVTAGDGEKFGFDEVTITVQAVPNADASLVGDWRMESTAGGIVTDASGAGRQATVVGSPSITPGVAGNALSLNKNDYMLVEDDPALRFRNQITIAAWIKPTTSGTQYVVRKGEQDRTDGFELSLSSAGRVFVRFNQASRDDAYRVDSTSKYPASGSVWMHVVATYDGATIKLYVNGVLQSSKNAVFQIAENSLPLSIGAQSDGYRGFAGAIDGVQLYNRALTASEVAALKANP